MKLIGVEFARSTQTFIQEEVRPLSGSHFPESTRLLTERYGFAVSPAPGDITGGAARFTGGRLIAGNKRINISDMTVFSNAVQVTTVTNTSDADFIIDDIMSWSINSLGFREPQTKYPRMYESALVVEFDKSADKILAPFEKLRVSFQRELKNLYNVTVPAQLMSFGLGVDPLLAATQLFPPMSAVLKPEFGIVRRANAPYAANRFFALAPLKTETHRHLLEEFERAIPR